MPSTVESASSISNTTDDLSDDERLVKKEILRRFDDASKFHFTRIGNKFDDGNTYTTVFSTSKLPVSKSWFYAYVDKTGCQLFEEGDNLILHIQAMLDSRRNLMQRLKDFDFLDIIGALIALPITTAFVYIVVTTHGSQDAISKEFLTIVSLILGYYFGRNKTK